MRRIQGVTGFVGTNPNERPRCISAAEAKNLLQKIGVIKSEKTVKIKQSYNVGDVVKITDGPFASFSGNIEEVNEEKDIIYHMLKKHYVGFSEMKKQGFTKDAWKKVSNYD